MLAPSLRSSSLIAEHPLNSGVGVSVGMRAIVGTGEGFCVGTGSSDGTVAAEDCADKVA